MTFVRFLLGVPLLTALLAGPVLAARSFRENLIPRSKGVDARLVDVVVVLSIITITSQVLGAIGWFSLPATIGLANASSALVLFASRRLVRPGANDDEGPRRGGADDRYTKSKGDEAADPWSATGRDGGLPWGRPTVAVAVGAVLLVLGSWIARTATALSRGITTSDSLWYHLPYAVRYVRTGRMTDVVPIDADSVTAFFPGTSSIYHALLYLVFDTDIVSAVVNLGWFALFLLAAWHIGDRFEVGLPTLMCGTLVLGTPGLVDTQPGGALTDVVGLSLMLVAVALAVHSEPQQTLWKWIPIGFALGLSTGMKFTFIVPAGLTALALALAGGPIGDRLRRLVVLVASAFATGGFWYVRNLLSVGNPVPALDVSIGPIRLPGIPGSVPQSSVADLLLDGTAWSEHLLPGLHDSLGPLWPLVLLAMVGGPAVALVRGRSPAVRALGAASLAMVVVFIWNPQYLFGGLFFATNLRYALPGLLIGIVLSPIPLRAHRQYFVWVVAAVIVVTQSAPAAWGLRAGGFFGQPNSKAALVAALVTMTLAALLFVAWRSWTRVPARLYRPGLAAGIGVAVIALAILNIGFQRDRYRSVQPFPSAYNVIREIHDVRIGVHGQLMQLKYGFAGADWSNDIRYLVVEEEDRSVRSARSCQEWVDGLRENQIDLVILTVPVSGDPISQWTGGMAGAKLLDRSPLPNLDLADLQFPPHEIEIYDLRPTVSDSHC